LLVEDALAETRRRLASLVPTADGIRKAGRVTVAFSVEVAKAEAAIKAHLNARLYRNPSVLLVMNEAEEIVTALFGRYWQDPDAIPAGWRDPADDDQRRGRRIADFLAGMTDRFALAEYARLFDRVPDFG
jgi:dGTPase